MEIIEMLLQRSPLTRLGVWIYGIVCFSIGAGFGILVLWLKNKSAKRSKNE